MSLYQGNKLLSQPLKHASRHTNSDLDLITPTDIGAASLVIKTITLTSSAWDTTNLTQSINVDGISAIETDQFITITPASTSQAVYYESGILCTGQAENSLMFKATTIPTKNLKVYVTIQSVEYTPPPPTYLTFKSPNSFTLKVNDATKHWNGTLEYSTDTSSWSTWDGTTTLSSAASGSDNVLYLRGTGNTVITGNQSSYRWVLTGTDVKCNGNIENLLDYATVESGDHPTMASYCYQSMFNRCTSLTQAPALPATTLSFFCYQSMFQGCTSLTQVSALPATNLQDYCYSTMFMDCTSLTKAPALPATTLIANCYYAMFRGCTKIKVSPVQTGEYAVPYRIPTSETGTTATDALTNMFYSTGGTFTGTPEINTTYYLSNTNTVVG